ncbi:MotA/TolQ/ExbB proton channel family protein [Marivita geojedonensis]|uniref:Flagellar motor protein MotA n=1 Tax=Marivita geojedonensis TaxID=1123756 RepID=A0A1X4NN44_9RHOB|nr:MotA/TolQ/ExbB proton channel family protein [Marivita geojedonensis]OSQ51918.1 flagellar motor protein MotA [Marivita geojedonensis]PRY81349.1 biopolymer transport protein ExbB [Marivita geojedonensis]
MPSSLSDIGTGGPIILLLLILSVFSLALIVYKIIQLWRVTANAPARESALSSYESGNFAEARKAVENGPAPADRVLAFAIKALNDGKSGPPLMTELVRRGNEEFSRMTNHIRLLELIAMISPLLGLLGTVLGMIQSFQELELAQGAANASVLAGGIWQALLTTAAGLLVAIPAAVGATLLSARAERGAQLIEGAVAQLMLIAGQPTT